MKRMYSDNAQDLKIDSKPWAHTIDLINGAIGLRAVGSTDIKWSDNELENKKIILLMLFKLIYDRGQMSLDEELLYLKNRYAKTSSKHLGFLNKDLERRNKEDFGEKKEEENKNVTFNQINNFTHFCIEYDKAKGILKKNDTESIPDNIIDVEPL